MDQPQKAKSLLASYFPSILAIIVLLVILLIDYLLILDLNDNHFLYSTDDAYIHMAISKNLVEHGTYGPTAYAFEAASSSLSWNFILAGTYLITGVNTSNLLIINIVLGILALLAMQKILLAWFPNAPNWLYIGALLAFIFFIPLPTMILSGMEHVFQVLVTLGVFYFAVEILVADYNPALTRHKVGLWATTTLLITVRFEAVFLISIIVLLLFLKKYFRFTIILGILNAIPLMLMVLVFQYNDLGLLPNSVLIKSHDAAELGRVLNIFINIHEAPSIFVFLFLSIIYLLFYMRRRYQLLSWQRSQIILLIVTVTALEHSLISRFGWLYRYEAYLITLIIFAVMVLVEDYRTYRSQQSTSSSDASPNKLSSAFFQLLLVAFAISLLHRGIIVNIAAPKASHDIYTSTYQAGTFLDTYYDGQAVIIADIGYPTYHADIHLLDLGGLGSYHWVKLNEENNANVDTLDEWATQENAQVAILYGYYATDAEELDQQIPQSWVLVGIWRVNHDRIVAFNRDWQLFAMNTAGASQLHTNLLEFENQLPAEVEFIDLYAETP